MSASLVGSEMCIRDSLRSEPLSEARRSGVSARTPELGWQDPGFELGASSPTSKLPCAKALNTALGFRSTPKLDGGPPGLELQS
eukprot:2937435-Alexandrium_andersonii.AAC.1